MMPGTKSSDTMIPPDLAGIPAQFSFRKLAADQGRGMILEFYRKSSKLTLSPIEATLMATAIRTMTEQNFGPVIQEQFRPDQLAIYVTFKIIPPGLVEMAFTPKSQIAKTGYLAANPYMFFAIALRLDEAIAKITAEAKDVETADDP